MREALHGVLLVSHSRAPALRAPAPQPLAHPQVVPETYAQILVLLLAGAAVGAAIARRILITSLPQMVRRGAPGAGQLGKAACNTTAVVAFQPPQPPACCVRPLTPAPARWPPSTAWWAWRLWPPPSPPTWPGVSLGGLGQGHLLELRKGTATGVTLSTGLPRLVALLRVLGVLRPRSSWRLG